MLANYAARKGSANPLVAQVGVGCHFDKKCFDHMTTYWFGFFDYLLGLGVLYKNQRIYEEYDRIVSKKHPEKTIGDLWKKSWTLSKDCAAISAKIGDYRNVDHYIHESCVTPRIHKIRKPFFFISALDDPFFGANVIPINHCYDQILIGTTLVGSHVSYVEGKYIPTGLWFPKPTFEFLQYFNS